MEPFRIVVDRNVKENLPTTFEKEEKHRLLNILDQAVFIDGSRQSLLNATKIYTRSVFEAINDNDTSKVKFYDFI